MNMELPKFDIVSIGDTTVDVFLEVDPGDSDVLCELSDKDCKVCFPYGAKVPVSKFTRVAAVGNAANHSVGSSRLGLNASIYTEIGEGRDADEIREVFEEESVDTSLVGFNPGEQSNFSAVLNYFGERTIFVSHQEREYKLPEFEASWIYLTSVAKEHQALHDQILAYVKNSGVKLAFNPGSYQLRDGLVGLAPLLSSTEVLIVNKEEASLLVGNGVHIDDIKGLMLALKRAGPAQIVITDGRDGSYFSFDGLEVWHAGIPEDSPVVERTGCGDAYSTGFLGAIIKGSDFREAMVWGTMNSTSVVQYVGAREGLLDLYGIEEFTREYGQFVRPRMI